MLADADIKQDILSQSDMNPQETVKAVEGKKCGKVAKMKVGAQDTSVKEGQSLLINQEDKLQKLQASRIRP